MYTRIIAALGVFLISFASVFAGGVSLKYMESELKKIPKGAKYVTQIDTLFESLSDEKLNKFLPKVQKLSQIYGNKTTLSKKEKQLKALIDYLHAKIIYELNPDLYERDTYTENTQTLETSDGTNHCDENKKDITVQYQDGFSAGWVIPNSCVSELKNGVFTQYYGNGNPKWEIPVTNGWYDGTAKWYYESGQLKAIGNYDNGEIIGEYLWYGEDGEIDQKNVYKNNGEVEVTLYHYNGSISMVYTTKNGKNHGSMKSYYSNGNSASVSQWNNGVGTGEHTYWYKNGEIESYFPLDDLEKEVIQNPSRKVQEGDTVVYISTLSNADTGEIIGSTILELPIEQETLIPGFYKNVIGMEDGASKIFVVPAAEAYGETGDHILAGMNLKFDIFIYEIERPKK